ncbi:NAD(P)H dehydrogenase-like [Scleropages formosus]|uniref:Ribosyldihydronicotinamide dehydrogenase [quinone] n=2 Tax=Scleropages formosus TaxID=113540 RepID=A0A0N8JVH8_SCLFO|nr:NAD(P)H dehydrogenase-like [Scleropages formosus]
MAKNVLIVYAHQSATSFNAAALDTAVKTLQLQKCNVVVSDLYAMKFKASATAEDITGTLKNPQNFQYGEESLLAWQEGRLSADIVEEQQKVKEAELVVFQFPMYWFTVPAILKGWFDRVFTQGFAYTPEKMYTEGIFKDKKAILSFTTGSYESMCCPDGINGDINIALWPLQNGILHYCGFQVLAPQIFWAVEHVTEEARQNMLEGWQKRLEGLLQEKLLTFAPFTSFDVGAGFKLKKEVQDSLATCEFGLTVGHHVGKPLPPDNQLKATV